MSKTKYQSQRTPLQLGIIDKLYNSFSIDFWLVVTNLVVITNWLLHPASLNAVGLMATGLGLVMFVTIKTSRKAQQLWRGFLRRYQNTGLLTLTLGILVGITVFNYATSPSQALILTKDGVDTLTKIMGGNGGGTGVGDIITSIITIFKVLFFIGFMWALYKAYEKYTDQAELQDVIKTPLILLIVVGLVDGAAKVFLAT
jgi:hypothetical protein